MKTGLTEMQPRFDRHQDSEVVALHFRFSEDILLPCYW